MDSYKLWSCFCLFDDCCQSKYKREDHSWLVKRMEKNSDKVCWLVRVIEAYKKEQRYVCCFDHCRRIMENFVISVAQNETLKTSCLLTVGDPVDEIAVENRNRHCFHYYQMNIVDLNDFCLGCKAYFVVLESFQLKKIRIIDGIIR